MTTTELTTTHPPPDDRVPVDERVLGFDRRTILPGVIALAMWFVWAHGLPWVDEQIEFDNPIVAGDVIDLGQGELTMTPAVGWNREDGLLVSETDGTVPYGAANALVTLSEVGFEVRVRPWDGTADELLDELLDTSDALDEIVFEDVQDRVAFANVDGLPGVLAPWSATEDEGFVAAYVLQVETPGADDDAEPATTDLGIEVDVRGSTSTDLTEDDAQAIVDMLTSIRYQPGAQDEEAGS